MTIKRLNKEEFISKLPIQTVTVVFKLVELTGLSSFYNALTGLKF